MGEAALALGDAHSPPLDVRHNGAYAEQKLEFLDRYVRPALTATQRKPARHYVELFAGPGRWRERGTSTVHDGSALRMIAAEGFDSPPSTFTHGTFVNLDPIHDATLRRLVAERARHGRCRIPGSNLRFVQGDANLEISNVMRTVRPYDYALVVVDFEKPSDWPWASVERLRAASPPSTDLYAMMPTHMGLLRLIARDHRKMLDHKEALNAFFGTDEWQSLVAAARNDRERRLLAGRLERMYCRRLQELGWAHAGVVRKVCRRGNQQLYSMIFASSNPVAKRLVDWETGTKPQPQLSFL